MLIRPHGNSTPEARIKAHQAKHLPARPHQPSAACTAEWLHFHKPQLLKAFGTPAMVECCSGQPIQQDYGRIDASALQSLTA
ncbi:hypothetical protein NDU88_007505 [Pleurodeles waltl]|uniref:Uncharacterized protein n=1 Tax=Pleurodeles waltl TaxID=8319 RepID=A0AAV7NWF8_PLEWA|nr:hypothetical protein NDU88_007505 [Pleurodeles waltl]